MYARACGVYPTKKLHGVKEIREGKKRERMRMEGKKRIEKNGDKDGNVSNSRVGGWPG